jgi:hypothetical protein
MDKRWAKMIWTKQGYEVEGYTFHRLTLNGGELERVGLDLPLSAAVGLDPGVNFGLAAINFGKVDILYGKLPKRETYAEYGVAALQLIKGLPLMFDAHTVPVAVEGAAHSVKHGQANLSYVRMGFYIGFVQSGHIFKPEMVAINTARKAATGHGNRAMWSLIPQMDHNAADALGLALYALGYDAKETKEDGSNIIKAEGL